MRLRLRQWARIHLEVEDLKVQIYDHQPRQQGDDDVERKSAPRMGTETGAS